MAVKPSGAAMRRGVLSRPFGAYRQGPDVGSSGGRGGRFKTLDYFVVVFPGL
jgi:hypothetical protein